MMVISLVLLLGTTLLLGQILQIEDFLLAQYVRTSDTLTHLQDQVLELRMKSYAEKIDQQP